MAFFWITGRSTERTEPKIDGGEPNESGGVEGMEFEMGRDDKSQDLHSSFLPVRPTHQAAVSSSPSPIHFPPSFLIDMSLAPCILLPSTSSPSPLLPSLPPLLHFLLYQCSTTQSSQAIPLHRRNLRLHHQKRSQSHPEQPRLPRVEQGSKSLRAAGELLLPQQE